MSSRSHLYRLAIASSLALSACASKHDPVGQPAPGAPAQTSDQTHNEAPSKPSTPPAPQNQSPTPPVDAAPKQLPPAEPVVSSPGVAVPATVTKPEEIKANAEEKKAEAAANPPRDSYQRRVIGWGVGVLQAMHVMATPETEKAIVRQRKDVAKASGQAERQANTLAPNLLAANTEAIAREDLMRVLGSDADRLKNFVSLMSATSDDDVLRLVQSTADDYFTGDVRENFAIITRAIHKLDDAGLYTAGPANREELLQATIHHREGSSELIRTKVIPAAMFAGLTYGVAGLLHIMEQKSVEQRILFYRIPQSARGWPIKGTKEFNAFNAANGHNQVMMALAKAAIPLEPIEHLRFSEIAAKSVKIPADDQFQQTLLHNIRIASTDHTGIQYLGNDRVVILEFKNDRTGRTMHVATDRLAPDDADAVVKYLARPATVSDVEVAALNGDALTAGETAQLESAVHEAAPAAAEIPAEVQASPTEVAAMADEVIPAGEGATPTEDTVFKKANFPDYDFVQKNHAKGPIDEYLAPNLKRSLLNKFAVVSIPVAFAGYEAYELGHVNGATERSNDLEQELSPNRRRDLHPNLK